MSKKDSLILIKVSEGSGKESFTETAFSQISFDAALETLSRKDDVTLMGNYEQSSSSWSEISILAHKQPFSFLLHLQSQLMDRQKSSATFSAIFNFGTEIMATLPKWKETKPVSLKSTALE